MQSLKNADYAHAKSVYKHFKRKILGQYHHSQVQIYTLLLADVFENFQNMS